LIEDLYKDLHSTDDQACPEPDANQTKTQKVTALVQWFVYFILLWQSVTKISDNGLEWLLQFVCQFFKVLSTLCESEYLSKLVFIFPSSLYLLRKFVVFDRDNFIKYAVCPKCAKVYNLKECTELDIYGQRSIRHCNQKKFPRSRVCGAPLARKVILSNGTSEFYPLHVYCYNSVINKLEEMVKRKQYPEKCELWRNLQTEDGFLSDITDGRIWKEFNVVNGNRFLCDPRNYLFILNFDFFQPKKHRNDYSVGVFYLSNLNLPCSERTKWENIIVVGIIPGLQKEPSSLNEFLDPFVKEMQVLWKGVYLKSSLSTFIPLRFRAALACVSCDIPAARKLCGFKGHNSNYGCSKCFKYFPGNVQDGIDYSGFERQQWPKRDMNTHRRNAKKLLAAKTKSKHDKLSIKFGMYYSSLLKLEYFNAIQFTVIDPMHNLFLGTAKSVFKIWLNEGILTKQGVEKIERKLKDFEICTGHGRLPHKISANYGCYTASQWKNWTLIYSMHVLQGILPEKHLQCWQAFVLACKFLVKPVVSNMDLDKADFMLMQFCRKFEKLYGASKVKPNMHLHGHLKECILDYGPMTNFWCFSFERFNGILGSFTTNNRSVEVQMMRKILAENMLTGISLPNDFKEVFHPIVIRKKQDNNSTDYFEYSAKLIKSSTTQDASCIYWKKLAEVVMVPKVYKVKVLDEDDLQTLHSVYTFMYGDSVSSLSPDSLPNTVHQFSYIHIGNEKFGSKLDCRSLRSARIMASWTSDDGDIELGDQRPGKVCHYIQHNVPVNQGYESHVFAVVDWYERRNDQLNKKYYKPVEAFGTSFVQGGPSRLLPVTRISSKFALASQEAENELIVVPLNRTFT